MASSSDPPRSRPSLPPAADVLALALRRAREHRASTVPPASSASGTASSASGTASSASGTASSASGTMPAVRSPSSPPASSPRSDRPSSPGAVRGPRWPGQDPKRPKILVVDDDGVTRRMLTAALAHVGDVLTAQDGAEALAIVADEIPSLVITDVVMPGVDGLDLTRQLKASPRTAHVPVVLLTARTGPAEMIAGVNAGARSYIAKPIDPATIEAKVRRALGR